MADIVSYLLHGNLISLEYFQGSFTTEEGNILKELKR